MNKNMIGSTLSKIFRYRWGIGLLIFILTVALEINCSSLGMWNIHIPNAEDPTKDIIFGQNRPIRSDEWCVFTPMAMSQYYNDFGLTSDILRGTKTDVFMVYGQPVRDWSIIFRPFQAGYLFLSPSRGLSFYWMGKLIFLFLVSLEFGLLFTGRKKLLAAAWSFALTFAPIVQWWFSINAFPDMLMYGQGIILCLHGYMKNKVYRKRALYALVFSWLSGCYLLVLYPAWQIPFFFVFLAICLYVIISNRKTFFFRWKKDLPLIGGSILLLVFCMGVIIHRSWDTVQAVMNSVYPGARMETGGTGINALFRYPGNIWLPYQNGNLPLNECECAVFFDLFPLGLMGAFLVLHKGKQKDGLTIALLIVLAFLGAYTIFGFPAWLSKATLMSRCPAQRVTTAVSFLNLLLLFRFLTLAGEQKITLKWTEGITFAITLGIGITLLSKELFFHEYLTKEMLLICTAVTAVLFCLVFTNRRLFCIGLCVLSLFIGGTVNPIRTGTSGLTDTAPAKAIRQLVSETDGTWLAVSEDFTIGDYLTASGARTLNSTNTYVNRDFWNVLDPEGIYDDIYNRYAHIIVRLTSSDTPEFELLFQDLIRVVIPVRLLKNLGVDYLFSMDNLPEFNTDACVFKEIYYDENSPYRIYSLTDTLNSI